LSAAEKCARHPHLIGRSHGNPVVIRPRWIRCRRFDSRQQKLKRRLHLLIPIRHAFCARRRRVTTPFRKMIGYDVIDIPGGESVRGFVFLVCSLFGPVASPWDFPQRAEDWENEGEEAGKKAEDMSSS